jgi:hypothetical protein
MPDDGVERPDSAPVSIATGPFVVGENMLWSAEMPGLREGLRQANSVLTIKNLLVNNARMGPRF